MSSKRNRRPSKAYLCSKGLDTDTGSSDSEDNGAGSATTVPSNAPAPALPSSQTSIAVASASPAPPAAMLATAGPNTIPAVAVVPGEALCRTKFEARFKCAATSDEDVLSGFI